MGIQVTELTSGLMPWGKEYIDFSFAGRHISEFGLVAVTNGDRYSFSSSPEFADETTEVNGVSGQYYWGTKFKTKTYTYNLATDGMTERQFEEFKRVFRPGHYGQFYEDAWFDRYCYVRLKSVANFSFIPFQEEVEVAGVKFMSRIYKGECNISFIQDRPFTYSFYQILESKIADLHTNNDNGAAAVRMMYHSNIPALDSWNKNVKCFTGGHICLPAKDSINVPVYEGDKYVGTHTDTVNLVEKAKIVPYYNPSTSSSESNISFTINKTTTPIITVGEWEPVYFNEIFDDLTNPGEPYNTIGISTSLRSSTLLEDVAASRFVTFFKYTLPEVSSQINKAIYTTWLFYQEYPYGAAVELQEKLQEEIVNSKVLLWSTKVIQKVQQISDYYNKTNDKVTINNIEIPSGCFKPGKLTVYTYPIRSGSISADWFGYFNIMMLMMMASCAPSSTQDIRTEGAFGDFYSYELKFLGEEGQAFTTYKYNYMNNNAIGTIEVTQENCSNIVSSSYLKMDGGDTIDITTGKVASFHTLGFRKGMIEDLVVDNIKIEYKYTYA